MRDYAGEEERTDDFHYDLGEVVYVNGLNHSKLVTCEKGGHKWEQWIDDSWRAKIIDRWYDDECLDITPWWFEVEPIDEPPAYRKRDRIIVHEREIQRYK